MALSVPDGVMVRSIEKGSGERPFLLIGNPLNKRTLGLQAARTKLGLAPAIVLPYEKLLQRSLYIGEVLLEYKACSEVMIRLDAPGEDQTVERELIAWGAPDRSGDDLFWSAGPLPQDISVTASEAIRLPQEHGTLLYPAQWYRGYCRFLAVMQQEAEAAGVRVGWVNTPDSIARMFDKRSCWQLLSRHGLLMPALPAPVGSIKNYDELQAAILLSGMKRLFIKLACGSGAAGVIAYQTNPRTGAEIAITTIGIEEFAGGYRFYNAGLLRRYQERSDIRRIVDWVCRQGAHVERWIEKESHDSKSFDVRQLVVGGQACHTVVRLSQTPITNLHLRNERRIDASELLSEELRQAVKQTAEAALRAFPGSTTAGVDVLVQRGNGMTYPIDINPFGDLLYGAEHEGMNTYEWQMLQLLGKD
ncbi:STM4014 family protein [Paenibacillus paridis]|uniref:STM4014 family protein n=1 Tax=Paenibacillus paridis TaxID=2583376 RepID=UPI00111E0F81|nr:STM4014 family protein [Paenibacillus paridis]